MMRMIAWTTFGGWNSARGQPVGGTFDQVKVDLEWL